MWYPYFKVRYYRALTELPRCNDEFDVDMKTIYKLETHNYKTLMKDKCIEKSIYVSHSFQKKDVMSLVS